MVHEVYSSLDIVLNFWDGNNYYFDMGFWFAEMDYSLFMLLGDYNLFSLGLFLFISVFM